MCKDDVHKIMTPSCLFFALVKSGDYKESEAKRISATILNLFGFNYKIIDNILLYEERKLFYKLETQGILGEEVDIVRLPDGRDWRIAYWILQVDKIIKMASYQEQSALSNEAEYDIYEQNNIWKRHSK